MTGYQLVERTMLWPEKANGIPALAEEMGILDFLRELEADGFSFPRLYEVQIVGLEEVLYAARPDDMVMALEIKRRLQSVASDLQGRLLSVQFVFQGTLMRGDTLWVEYRGQRLPIGHIFGSPLPETDAHGNRFFRAGFALT